MTQAKKWELGEQRCQGELMLIACSAPRSADLASEVSPDGARLIVGHSETGHHHTVAAPRARLYRSNNPLLDYLHVQVETALEHTNPVADSHHMPTLLDGDRWYEVRHQTQGDERTLEDD